MPNPNTASTQIEQALRESQDRLTGILASAMDAIITIDSDRHIILFNKAAEEMFGYTAGQILGHPIDHLLPERFRERHRQHIHNFGETGVTNRTMGRLGTLYGLRPNGEEFQIEASISQVQTATGKLFTVILRDVTARVEAEEKLIDSEQQLRATFEQAAVGIGHIAPDGRFLRVNQRVCDITGFTREEMLSRTYHDVTHPDDLPKELDLEQQLLAGIIPVYALEKRYIRKDSSIIWVNVTVSAVRDLSGSPKYLIKVVEDVTARKQAEAALLARNEELKAMTQQLWQSAKLATMGELAASIAHELNNPLAILSLRIESLLANHTVADSELHELQVMEQEVERMASLVANLLQFSRSTQREVSSLDLREEIDKTLELIHTHLVHRRITIDRQYAARIPLVQADRQQLRQLFLNLFTNASDAMQTGGTLTIQVIPVPDSHTVQINIRDTGVGIRPSELRQVMEPFYTTKGEGKGTGLGLAICRRIAEEHHGSLQISSPGVNQGAIVQVVLPGQNKSKPELLLEE